MASDLSSACTEAIEILDDEKEEGEISLEDVSSSEDGPPYRYQPGVFGQCPYCLSMGHCATWCRSLTLNKMIFVRASQRKPLGKVQAYARAEVAYIITKDAGKENQRHHHYHHHGHQQQQRRPAAVLSEGFQVITSDEDLELVGLAKKKKTRKKRRRKKSSSLSLSPSPVDMAVKDSIHRRYQSPIRRKPQQQHKSPPTRKPSPQRMKKLKRPIDEDSPLQSRGTVTKLLKKVKKLEPFSSRSKDKRSSLKDKLSKIIGGKKSDEEEIVVIQFDSKDKSQEVEKREVTKTSEVQPLTEKQKKQGDTVEQQKKQEVAVDEKKKEVIDTGEKKGDNDEVSRKITLTINSEAALSESSEVSKPPLANEKKQSQVPDEDLQLRVIALRSVVLKKHRTRLARAKKLQQQQQQQASDPVPRIESPFTSSFNEDFPLLAEICSPGSLLNPKKDDIYCPEDMDLDSDMELDKEISMMLSGAEDESNDMVNGNSPYSPTDELGSPRRPIDQPMDLTMYTPSKPTETPMAGPRNKHSDTLNGSTFESRPYSPSDATVYDPELPGVLGTNAACVPPPPPLPPLGMMPMMPMNLLPTYPIMPMPGFAPVNSMLTAPFIPFTPTTAANTVSASTTTTQLVEEFETDLDGSPLVPIEPKDTNWKFVSEPLYLPEMDKLPLVGLVPTPVLKCNKQLQKTPPMKKPCESLFRNAEMRPVAIEEENKNSGATFKPIKLPTPVKKAVTTQPAAAFGASTEDTADSQKQIWPELEQDLKELEELEQEENRRKHEMEEKNKQEQREGEERKKQEQEELEKRKKQEQHEAEEKRRHEKEEAERKKKREREEADRKRRQTPIRKLRQKSVTPAPRARRRSARTPSRARDLYKHNSSRSLRDSEDKSESKKTESSKEENSDERMRKLSIEDDEVALREILLASLAKRKPNPKRKAALEAAKKKAALEAAKTTSDKENIAEKSSETTPVVAEAAEELKDTAASVMIDAPQSTSPSNNTETTVLASTVILPSVLMPAVFQQPTLKRPAPTPLLLSDQPLRKIIKKLNVIPASTRAVNNAKRYRNLLVQRKLNQQKLALCKTDVTVDNGQPTKNSLVDQSPSKAEKVIISLNENTESDCETHDKKKKSPAKSRPELIIPTTDFEKSVDQFLKGVRMQQEGLVVTSTSVTISMSPIVAIATSSVTNKTTTSNSAVDTIAIDAIAKVAIVTPTTLAKVAVTTPATISKVAVTTSTTIAKVAVTAPATIAASKIVAMPAAVSSTKERTVLNIPKPISTAGILSIPATPQAVRHLPVPQQEEYRRLKQQLYEYEQLRLQKAKESAAATTLQAQPTTVKPINTLSSLITSSYLSTVLVSSTQKAKFSSKMQLLAALSPVSKPNNVAPIVVTPTKIIHSTSNVTTKTIAPTVNPASKAANLGITVPSSSKPVVTSIAKATPQPDRSQLKLLSKITESLNSQKTLLNSAANKISSLRVLTKEQINRKTSRIQQKNSCVVMDDLNKTGENNAVAQKESNSQENIKGKKMSKEPAIKVEKDDSIEEASPAVEKSIDENKPKQTWNDFRQVVDDEVQTLSNLSTVHQKKLLSEMEEKLIAKRHAVLDDITEMSSGLRQWEIERDLQNIITAEIISLRQQLRIAEEKLQGQKQKLQTIQPKVTLYHEKINTGRKQCFRLSKICNRLGQQIIGSDYKVPIAGAVLLNNRIKEVAIHTQKLRGKKTSSVQSSNSAKTSKLLKNYPKANVNLNFDTKETNRRQRNVAVIKTSKPDSIQINLQTVKKEVYDDGACLVVPNIAETPNTNTIFNKNNSNQLTNINKEKLCVNISSLANSVIKESIEKSQSTNLNSEQGQNSNRVQKCNTDVVSVVTVDNTATSMEIDNWCDSQSTNNDVGTDESSTRTLNTDNGTITSNVETTEESNSNSVKNTVSANSEVSNMEVVEKAEGTPKNNKNIDNNLETPSIANNSSIQDPVIKASNQIITQVLDMVRLENETASSSNEMLPAVEIGQSAEIMENSSETSFQKHSEHTSEVITNTDVQKNVTTESENIADDICTSNSISNNAVEGAPDKMETENVNVNITNEIRTDEQSVNSGPTIVVITDNIESDSVNNINTSNGVNTSLNNYIKKMSVSDDCNKMCSKDCKNSASVTTKEHSTTFDEEVRLLELASENEIAYTFTSNSQSIAKADYETIDNCQTIVKEEREPIANCQTITREERESIDDCQAEVIAQHGISDNCQPSKVDNGPMNSSKSTAPVFANICESSIAKNKQHMTDNSSTQNLPKKVSNKAFRPYESILKLVRAPRNDKTDGILCPFALMGTCIDNECRYIHQPTSHCR